MKNQIIIVTIMFVGLLIVLFSNPTHQKNEVIANSNVCPNSGEEGWTKYDWSDSDKSKTHDAGTGNVVTEVCVFGGNNRKNFTTDGIQSCWVVSGINTQIATASENWPNNDKNSDCKDISHVSFKIGISPTPTSTPTPSLTPSVTPTPTTEPTPTPEEPTPTPTTEPTPTPEEPTPTPTTTTTTETKPESKSSEKKSSDSSAVGGIQTVEPQTGQVLGVATYAETGVVEDAVISVMGLIGAGATVIGYASKIKKS